MHPFVSAFAIALMLVACSNKTPQPTGAATSTPSVMSAASATPTSAPPPGWTLLQEFPKDTRLFAVGSAVIACEDRCEFTSSRTRRPPKMWWVDRKGKQEKASLWPDAAYKRLANLDVSDTLVATGTTGAIVGFRGEAPAFTVSTNEVWGHDEGIDVPVLVRSGDDWRLRKKSDDAGRLATKTDWNSGFFRPAPPHRFDEALLGSDIDCEAVWSALYWGGSGPLLRVETDGLGRWQKDHWQTQAVPWPRGMRPSNGVRLVSGATLIAGPDKSWIVSPEGELAEIPVPTATTVKSLELRLLDDRPVLFVFSDKVQLWGATGAADVETVWEEREPAPTVFSEALRLAVEAEARRGSRAAANGGAPAATEGDAGVASDSTSADKPASLLPKAAIWTDECKTPYVLLSRSSLHERPWHQGWLKLLVGHPELQNKLRFLDSWDDQLEFGAQAQTEADARALMSILKAKAAGYKPQLLCRDLASQLPRLGETAHVREVPANLTVGCQGRP